MNPGALVPSLSTDGWISDPVRALDRIMSYFFESDKSQTYSYGKNVASLAWIYATYAANPDQMATELVREVESLLQRYFPKAQAYCSAKEYVDNDNLIELTFAVQVTDSEGRTHDFNKMIKGNKTKVLEIVDYLNG